jgi:hypothetical protein
MIALRARPEPQEVFPCFHQEEKHIGIDRNADSDAAKLQAMTIFCWPCAKRGVPII